MAKIVSSQAEKKETLNGQKGVNNLMDHGDSLVKDVQNSIKGADVRFEVGVNLPSEIIGEDRSRKGDGDFSPVQNDQEQAEEIRDLIKKDPQRLTKQAVTYFIKKAVHREIAEVQIEINHLSRDVIGNAFELSEALIKLKKLKLIMKNLAHWTIDFLRSMFQRVQKGEKFFNAPIPQD